MCGAHATRPYYREARAHVHDEVWQAADELLGPSVATGSSAAADTSKPGRSIRFATSTRGAPVRLCPTPMLP